MIKIPSHEIYNKELIKKCLNDFNLTLISTGASKKSEIDDLKKELNLEKKVNIIATLHPAYLLRAPNQKKLAWEDLKMIRDKFILIQNNQNL